jgi:acid phosphatase (class A)
MEKLAKKFLVLTLLILTSYIYGGDVKVTNETAAKIYVAADAINLVNLLPPPPAMDSKETAGEIEEMLRFQNTRTPAMVDYAQKDQTISVFRFATVLGDNFNEGNLPFTAGFFRNVQSNASLFIDPAKDYWKRPRPSNYDRRIIPCLTIPKSAAYPSGHSTEGNLFAIILANMIPEKRAVIFNRGWEFAMNRVIGGVHYPSDAMAGRISAALIAQELFGNAGFKKDYETSKAEIRKALGLSNE